MCASDLPVKSAAGSEKTFSANVCREILPSLAATRGIANAVLAIRNPAITQASSAKDDRAGDRYLEGAILVETTGEAGAATVVAALSPDNLRRAGCAAHLIAAPCVLRLMYALHAAPSAASKEAAAVAVAAAT